MEEFASNAQRNPKGNFQRMNHALPPHPPSNIGMGRGHWNAEGHRTAAELIARHLCARQS